ncbi:hypothetical protein CEP53_006121 [Fusarium sp. AF-6]|nr:hypothetical protein CEP53_006121 [Fusarium sp. AF-6]
MIPECDLLFDSSPGSTNSFHKTRWNVRTLPCRDQASQWLIATVIFNKAESNPGLRGAIPSGYESAKC